MVSLDGRYFFLKTHIMHNHAWKIEKYVQKVCFKDAKVCFKDAKVCFKDAKGCLKDAEI